MKYVIEYSIRSGGLSYTENFEKQQSVLSAFSKWEPEEGLAVHTFLSRLDSAGGFVVLEADDPKAVASFLSKFSFWNDVDVVPVADVQELVPVSLAAMAWARSASAG